MVEVAKVTMFGLDVGSFVWDDSYKVARFEYDDGFVGRGIEGSGGKPCVLSIDFL